MQHRSHSGAGFPLWLNHLVLPCFYTEAGCDNWIPNYCITKNNAVRPSLCAARTRSPHRELPAHGEQRAEEDEECMSGQNATQ